MNDHIEHAKVSNNEVTVCKLLDSFICTPGSV